MKSRTLKYIILSLIIVLLSNYSFTQNDSIPTIFLEKVNKKGTLVTKRICPRIPFYLRKYNETNRSTCLALEDVLDSSIVITRKEKYKYVKDTIPFNQIMIIWARTKEDKPRATAGVVSIVIAGSSIVLTTQTMKWNVKNQPTQYARKFFVFNCIGSLYFLRRLVVSRRFETDIWQIREGKYPKCCY